MLSVHAGAQGLYLMRRNVTGSKVEAEVAAI